MVDTLPGYKRGDKFQSYKSNKYLQEYILISSDKRCIEQFYRDENGHWQTGKVISEGILALKIMPFQLTIEDIYRKADF